MNRLVRNGFVQRKEVLLNMLLISGNKNIIRINESDIQYFAKKLKMFVKYYYDHIYIEDDSVFEKLHVLDNIAEILLNKQYSEVFDDNIVIEYDKIDVLFEVPF